MLDPSEPIRLLQQQGQLAEAIGACRQQLDGNDDHSLRALLGILYCQNDEPDAARECLNAVLNGAGELCPAVRTDLAGIHLLLGESALAMQQLDAALEQQPDFVLAQVRRGLVAMQTGQYEKARRDLTAGLEQFPPERRLPLHINLARCAVNLGEADTALQHVEQAQPLGGSGREQWLLVAIESYIAVDRWAEAEQAIEQALAAGLAESRCSQLLALLLAAQDKHGEAEHLLRKALANTPDDIDLLVQLSSLASVQGHFGEAIHCLHQAIGVEPDNASLWAQLAQLGKRLFDEQGAYHAAEKALALTENEVGLQRAEALVAMASVESDAGKQTEAEQYYQQALVQVPGYIPACLGLGHLLLQWGRVDEAVAQFEAVTQRHPTAGYGALISARRFPDNVEVLANIEKMANIPSLEGPVQSSLLFDLAAAWEHRKDYDKAFHFVSEANRASRKFLPYSAVQHRADSRALILTFDKAFYAARAEFGVSSTRPVFVLGMPRSGTTLVEQILGGHPAIHGAGEIGLLSGMIQKLNGWERHVGSGQQYPECVNDLTAGQSKKFAALLLEELDGYDAEAGYIVDKLPHNFENIGLIRLLFPEAAIIHVLREPRDVAVSNYFTDYQAKFGGMGFAYDLEDIGQQLADYQNLMNHWNATVTKPILTVRYEDVVENVEHEARRMLEYIGVDWTPAVLNHQNLERAVKTASVWQVRQPIYKTSKAKWRRYEAHLAPLEAVLQAAEPPDPPSEAEQEAKTGLLPPGLFFDGMRFLKASQGRQADAVFARILARNPDHAAATHMQGVTRLQQGRLSEAVTLLERSIERHPGHPGWYQNLAVAYQAQGRLTEAAASRQKAQQLHNLHDEQSEIWQ